MKTNNIKTVDILTKTWFDKINGNTYFSQKITINRGRKSEETIINPFQYGYSSFEYFALQRVGEHYNLRENLNDYEIKQKISIRHELVRNCKKRELTNISA